MSADLTGPIDTNTSSPDVPRLADEFLRFSLSRYSFCDEYEGVALRPPAIFKDTSWTFPARFFVATIPNTGSGELLQRIDSAIKRSPHLASHQVFCQEESGIVVLHGKVRSFFEKQMAQEALKRLEGVERVINELEVDWMSSVRH